MRGFIARGQSGLPVARISPITIAYQSGQKTLKSGPNIIESYQVLFYPGEPMATAAVRQQVACPWCGQPISQKLFVDIEARIRAEEKRRFDAAEAAARARFAEERQTLETRHKADRTSL